MPLTSKGSEILAKMKAEYGDERGQRVFYASKEAGRITGVDSDEFGARDDSDEGWEKSRRGALKMFVLKKNGHRYVVVGDGNRWGAEDNGLTWLVDFDSSDKAKAFIEKEAAKAGRSDAVDPQVTKAKEDGADDKKRGQKYKNPYSKERTPTLHAAYKEAYQGAEARGDSLLSEMDAINERLDAAPAPEVREALLRRMDSVLDRMDVAKFTVEERDGSPVGHFKTKAEAEAKLEALNSRNDANEREVTKAQRDRKIKDGDWEATSDVSRYKRQDMKTHKGDRFTIYIKDWNDDRWEAEFANDSDKLPKPSVSYGAGNATQSCQLCVHFVDASTCDLVEGMIEPDGWCDRFVEAGRSDAEPFTIMKPREGSVTRYKGWMINARPTVPPTGPYAVLDPKGRTHGEVAKTIQEAKDYVDAQIKSRSDSLSDDLRELKSRLLSANNEAVAKAIRAKIAEVEERMRTAAPEVRGDASTSPEYSAALEKSRAATREFDKATKAYRAREIGDDAYLAARKKYKEAEAEFDKAFANEEGRGDANELKASRSIAAYLKTSDWRPHEIVGWAKRNGYSPEEAERLRGMVEDEYKGVLKRSDATHSKLDVALARAAKLMGKHFSKGTRSDADDDEDWYTIIYDNPEQPDTLSKTGFKLRVFKYKAASVSAVEKKADPGKPWRHVRTTKD